MNEGALIIFKPIHGEPSIPGARCDHDRSRLDPFSGREVHAAGMVAAIERDGSIGNRNFRPELLCLAECAAHQRHAGNTGWEP